MVTVREVIEMLEKLPQDMPVWVATNPGASNYKPFDDVVVYQTYYEEEYEGEIERSFEESFEESKIEEVAMIWWGWS